MSVKQTEIGEMHDPIIDRTLSWGHVERDGEKFVYIDECNTSDGGDSQTVLIRTSNVAAFVDQFVKTLGVNNPNGEV